MNLRGFVRMARWARNPPSDRKVAVVAVILAVCIILFAVERWIGWPAWLVLGR